MKYVELTDDLQTRKVAHGRILKLISYVSVFLLALLVAATGCRKKEPPTPDPWRWPSAVFAETQARQYSNEMALRFVIASKFENRPVSKEKIDYIVHEWTFLYANSAQEYIVVSVDEKKARINQTLAESKGRGFEIGTRSDDGTNELFKANWDDIADYPTIKDWQIGSIRADQIAARNGGRVQAPGRPGQGLFFLRMGKKRGKLIPFWLVPHRFGSDRKIVRADIGALVKLEPDMFK